MSDIIYLYLKTHNKTGLKYIGITKKNPYKYKGSGLHWKRHLDVHGPGHSTEILHECDETNVKEWGQYYSEKYNIVESNEFANLKPETGYSGSGMYGQQHSEETKKKMSLAQIGRPKSDSAVAAQVESRKATTQAPGYINPLKGVTLSRNTKDKISKNHHDVSGENNPMFGKSHCESTKLKISKRAKDRVKLECPHCLKMVDPANFNRWHGDNCKKKP